MKKFTIVSILAALFLGLFTGCDLGSNSYTTLCSITWRSDYGNPPEQKFVEKGYFLTEEDFPVLTDPHHEFLYWHTEGSKSLSVGYAVNTDTVFSAVWSTNKYTITYVTEHGETPSPSHYEYNSSVDPLNLPNYLEATGYKLLGWSFEENGEIIEEEFHIEKDITLYAVWEPVKGALNHSWYLNDSGQPKFDKTPFTKITLQLPKYTGPYSESWECNRNSPSPYTAYINGTEIIISANSEDGINNKFIIDNGDNLFIGFSNVKEIIFPEELDTSNVTNMYYMFTGCSSLETLDLSKFDTSNVTDMAYMFSDCSSLKSIDVSKFNTQNVTRMNYMFKNCTVLKELDVSNFDTKKVTNMESMFQGCENLTTLNVSYFETAQVTNMAAMFSGCINVTQIDVSTFNTSKVTNMISMFASCEKVKKLDVSHFDTSNVTNVAYMFYGCKAVEVLDVSNFVLSNIIDLSYMFRDCQKVKELDLSKFDTSLVTNMGALFQNCYELEDITFNIHIDTSNVTCMSSMFRNCNALKLLDTSEFNTSKVTDMRYMFEACTSIERLYLNNFDTSNVTDMYCMFFECSNLQKIYVKKSFEIGKVTDKGTSMFSLCFKLEGGNGTTYEDTEAGKNFTYAHIDGEQPYGPGYFTKID